MLVGDNIALIRVDKAQALTQPPVTAEGSEEFCLSDLRGSRPCDN